LVHTQLRWVGVVPSISRKERPMDDVAAVYRLRAEECLALALDARDEVHREQSIEMAMYWFKQAESMVGGATDDASLVIRRSALLPARSGS
jgi:hypothetical protein